MNEILKVDLDTQTVSARELHNQLGISTRFNDWFHRMTEYGFSENVDFYSKMSKTSETGGRPSVDYDISVDMAKLICQNGYQIGQKRLFEWLRNNGYLCKSGSSRNMPMQRYVEQGLFEVKESNVQNPDGSIRITRTTKITGKGQLYFVNKFLGREIENGRND